MKYTTPNYEIESVETKDIITESVAIKDAQGKDIAYVIPSDDGTGQEVWVPDVGNLI